MGPGIPMYNNILQVILTCHFNNKYNIKYLLLKWQLNKKNIRRKDLEFIANRLYLE